MKNLATCKPSEFVAQTAKIKEAVASWVKAIDLINIRNTKPNYITLPAGATVEERTEVIKKNAVLEKQQTMENLSKILDKMLIEHPQETLNVLALACFVEPEHVDDYTIDEYLGCIMEMMQSKSVMSFFTLFSIFNLVKQYPMSQ